MIISISITGCSANNASLPENPSVSETITEEGDGMYTKPEDRLSVW